MAKRILIADDSVTIQKAFAMTFAGADDVTVSGARSADEGLSLAQRTHPDLIIADGVMPGRSGYDLCASIKADPALRAVPVLILASTQQPYDAGRGQKAGADGQLTKPWETNAMMEKVREVLRGGAPAHVPAAPPAGRAAASLPTAAINDDDEYGEISIDTDRETAPTAPRVRATTPPPAPPPAAPGRISSPGMPVVPAAPAAAPPPAAGGSSPGMRPSLIPGMRPGAMPPARPGTMPVRPTASAPLPATTPPRPTAQPVGRTLMGVPAANIPIPGVMRPSMPSMPAMPSMPSGPPMAPPAAPPPRQPTGPAAPLDMRARVATPPPRQRVATPPPAARPAIGTPVSHASVSASVEQKLAALSAKGPEYEAIAKLSREIIEQVVWEVVPELAEAIIREHVKNKV
jgi:DNA-binding response OmpR family regulator